MPTPFGPKRKPKTVAQEYLMQDSMLILVDLLTEPWRGAGYNREYANFQLLRQLGYRVTLHSVLKKGIDQPYLDLLNSKGINVIASDIRELEPFLQRNKFQYIMFCRPHTFVLTYELVKRYQPQAKLIYDAESLFTSRNMLKDIFEGLPTNEQKIYRLMDGVQLSLEGEIAIASKVDQVICVSHKDKALFNERGYLNTHVVGYPTNTKKPDPFEGRKGLLFVGGMTGHRTPNTVGIRWFLENVYQYLEPDIPITIVGEIKDSILKSLQLYKNVTFTGYVQDIHDYYNIHKVFFVPTQYCAGISCKTVEAMSYGIPVVCTNIIAEQLGIKDVVYPTDNPEEFAKCIKILYNSKDAWNLASQMNISHTVRKEHPTHYLGVWEKVMQCLQ